MKRKSISFANNRVLKSNLSVDELLSFCCGMMDSVVV